jgi:asparagine synthase (glutamine-hydrolysing)
VADYLVPILEDAEATFNLFMHWGLYKIAQAQGVRVLLDGFDGDSTVSHGLARLTELAREGRWAALCLRMNALYTWRN